MENNQLSMLPLIFKNCVAEIKESEQGVSLAFISDDEIRKAIRYVIVLLGVSADKIPKDEFSKKIIIISLKKNYPNLKTKEIILAFEYAICKKINVDLNLYGTFSFSFVSGVINAYLEFKRGFNIYKSDELKMNNQQRLAGIVGLLSEETKEKINNLAKPVEKKTEQPKQNNPYQEYFKEFDELFKRQDNGSGGTRFVKYNDKMLNCEEFVLEKIKENK